MTEQELAALEALAAAATPGPWTVNDVRLALWQVVHEDAVFIAAARGAVPALVAEVRRLRDERDEARADFAEQVHVNLEWRAMFEAEMHDHGNALAWARRWKSAARDYRHRWFVYSDLYLDTEKKADRLTAERDALVIEAQLEAEKRRTADQLVIDARKALDRALFKLDEVTRG